MLKGGIIAPKQETLLHTRGTHLQIGCWFLFIAHLLPFEGCIARRTLTWTSGQPRPQITMEATRSKRMLKERMVLEKETTDCEL